MKSNCFCHPILVVVSYVILQLTFTSGIIAQNVDRISEREVERRQAALPRGVEAVARGQAAMQTGNYRLAHDEFRNALNLLPDAVTSAKSHDDALNGFCESGTKLAEQEIANGQYAEAESIVREVLEDRYDPNCRPALDLLAHLQQPGYFNKTMSPAFVEKIEEVKKLLAEAQGYYDSGRYDLAFKKYEQVLAIDPYNTAARHGEEKIDNTKYNYSEEAYNETRGRQLAAVQRAWEQPVKPYKKGIEAVVEPEHAEVTGTARTAQKLNSIIIPRVEFRDASVREAIDFLRQQAVANDSSSDSKKGVNIVLRTVPLGQPMTAPPVIAPPQTQNPAAPGVPGENVPPPPAPVARATSSSQPCSPNDARITLDLVQIPVGEALRYIASQACLKVKVEPYAVLVVPLTEPGRELITKRYHVPPEFFGGPLDVGYYLNGSTAGGGAGPGQQRTERPLLAQGIVDKEAAQFQSATAVGPLGTGTSTLSGQGTITTREQLVNDRQLVRRADATTYLGSMGVGFPTIDLPDGRKDTASASFFPHSGVLIVRNTQDNLDLVDALVDQANASIPKQVQIEAKFVEINQNNLKELGFDWLLGQFNIGNHKVFGGGGTTGTDAGPGVPAGDPNYPFAPPGGVPVGQFPVTGGNRSGTLAITGNTLDALLFPATGLSTAAPGIFALSGVFTDPQFQVVIRALNQKKGIDLLSAPQVTTKSGQRAIIEIVREFRYPTSFTEPKIPDIQSRGSSNPVSTTISLPVVGPSTPQNFEERDTGVTLEVEPVVGSDGVTIDLNLVPQVVEFEGFINYGSPIKTVNPVLLGLGGTVAGLTGASQAITLTDNVINQPIFSTRKVTTSVSVWDGQTVVLGGLMREDVQKVEDRTPIIGDIPLVGRLFRSNVDQHIKRNLIIFVTAKVVNAAGQPVNQAEDEEEAVEPPIIPAYKK